MELEHQTVLNGFESHNTEQPAGEIDTFLYEAVAPGLSEVLVDPTEDSLWAEGSEPLDEGQETQEGDVQAAHNDGYTGGEATGQDGLGKNVGEEQPTRGCRQKSLLQIITARSWQAARYDAARLA